MKRIFGLIMLAFFFVGCAANNADKTMFYAMQQQAFERQRLAEKERMEHVKELLQLAGTGSTFKVEAPEGKTLNAKKMEVNLAPLFLMISQGQVSATAGQSKVPEIKQYIPQPTTLDRIVEKLSQVALSVLPGLWPYLTAKEGFDAAKAGYTALTAAAANAGGNTIYTQTISGENNQGRIQPTTNNVSGTGHVVTGPVDQTSTPTVVEQPAPIVVEQPAPIVIEQPVAVE